MALYTPAHFLSDNPADAPELMRAYPFATLISSAGADLQVTHLPLLWQEGGAHGELCGHMAKANPHWQLFERGQTIAVFHGPHAYISPSWYLNPDREVPTWNYSAVHAQGLPEFIEGRDAKLALIDRTTAQFERGNTPPWTRKVEGARLDGMLKAIVAFRMPIARIEAKFKLNQNRTEEDRAKVIGLLRDTAHPDLAAMASWMEAHERG